MIPTANLLAFSLTALLLVLLPGPSVLFAIGRALALGRRAAFISVVGNALGMYVQVIAVSLGLGVLLTESIVLMTIVKLAGAGFLVYLGIQAIRHRHDAAAPVERVKPLGPVRNFLEGAFVGLTNPKTIVFFLAILPQFVAPSTGTALGIQMLVLGGIFVTLGVIFDSIYAIVAGSAREWFGNSPKRLSGLGVAGGVAMIGLGVGLAVTGAVEAKS